MHSSPSDMVSMSAKQQRLAPIQNDDDSSSPTITAEVSAVDGAHLSSGRVQNRRPTWIPTMSCWISLDFMGFPLYLSGIAILSWELRFDNGAAVAYTASSAAFHSLLAEQCLLHQRVAEEHNRVVIALQEQISKLQNDLAGLSKNQDAEATTSSTMRRSPKGTLQQPRAFPVLLGGSYPLPESLDKQPGQLAEASQPACTKSTAAAESLASESAWTPINVVPPPLTQNRQQPTEVEQAPPIRVVVPPILHEAPERPVSQNVSSGLCLPAQDAVVEQQEGQYSERRRSCSRRLSSISCPPSCGSWEVSSLLPSPQEVRHSRRSLASFQTSPAPSSSVSMPARMSRLSVFSKQPLKGTFSMWPVWMSVYTGELWSGDSNMSFLVNQRTWAEVMRKLNSFDQHPKCKSNSPIIRTLQSMVMHPSCFKRVIWTVASMIFISYDLVVAPLTVFGLKDSLMIDLMTWSSSIFWTLDFPMSMFVGYHEKGNLEMDVFKTIRKYATTWMTFDSCLILADWLVIVLGMWIDENSAAGARTLRMGKTLRTARTLRGLRLLRVMKMPKVVKDASYLVGRSEYTSLTLGIFRHLFGILVINHFIACMWYFIGQPSGWVSHYAKDDSTAMVYFKSLHWSLTQFTPATMSVQPQTFGERVFAVAVLLFALITFSSFVSSITNLMTHLRNLRSAEIKQFMKVERYLHDQNISFHLSVRVRRYLEHLANEQQRNLQEKDVELLQRLSTPLYMELRYEVHFPTLSKHPVFLFQAMANLPVVQRVCLDSLKSMLLCAGDALFSVGDTATAMYFAQRGVLLYGRGGALKSASVEQQSIMAGQWFSEVVLWTPWEHRGEMRAETETSLLAIEAAKFHDILKNNRGAAQELVEYAAAVVERLNECEFGQLTDLEHQLFDSEVLAKQAFNIEDDQIGSPSPSLRNLFRNIVDKKESFSRTSLLSSARSSGRSSGQKSGASSLRSSNQSSRRSSQQSSRTCSGGSHVSSQRSQATGTQAAHGP